MIAIVDYGAGNLQSVKNALDRIEVASMITDDRKQILNAEKVIFPGQGHFGYCLEALKQKHLRDTIFEVASTKPFLGICLGMQILFEKSEEAPGMEGLGMLKGEVKKFSSNQKLPQMGWNSVHSADLKQLDGQYFYFAHSYYCVSGEEEALSAQSDYGIPFLCAVKKGALLAVQFHPEKSGSAGLAILSSFAGGAPC